MRAGNKRGVEEQTSRVPLSIGVVDSDIDSYLDPRNVVAKHRIVRTDKWDLESTLLFSSAGDSYFKTLPLGETSEDRATTAKAVAEEFGAWRILHSKPLDSTESQQPFAKCWNAFKGKPFPDIAESEFLIREFTERGINSSDFEAIVLSGTKFSGRDCKDELQSLKDRITAEWKLDYQDNPELYEDMVHGKDYLKVILTLKNKSSGAIDKSKLESEIEKLVGIARNHLDQFSYLREVRNQLAWLVRTVL